MTLEADVVVFPDSLSVNQVLRMLLELAKNQFSISSELGSCPMTKRFFAAALAGMVTIAVVGGLLYGVVFAQFFRANVTDSIMRRPPGYAWIALSHVPFGILLALAVQWRGVLTPAGGALTGAFLGLLMALSYNLAHFGTTTVWTLRLTLVEPFITMIMVAIAGAVTAAVLAK